MLSWSVRWRLTYLAIILVVLAIVAFGAFIVFQKPPSCTDGKQNQNELGVDCGGSCANVCITEITPLKILWSRLFALGPGKYDVAALVKNPNPKHSATEVKYTFRLWDKDNLLINSKTGSALLNPKEDLVIFQSRVDVGKKTPTRISFEIDEAPIWQKVDRVPPQLAFSNKRFTDGVAPRLIATLKNDSINTVSAIEVFAILSDADQNAVAVSSTFVEELPAGETREVSFTWPAPLQKTVSFIDLAAHFDWRKLPLTQSP